MTAQTARKDTDEENAARARRLMAEAFVFNSTDVPTSDAECTQLGMGYEKVDSEKIVSSWKAQGYKGLLIPQGWLELDDLSRGGDNIDYAVRTFLNWTQLVASHPESVGLVLKPGDMDRYQKAGLISYVLGAHNGGDAFRSVDDVDMFHEMGLRHTLISCFGQNRICSSVDHASTEAGPADKDSGLTRFGYEIVERMNRVGMAVDLSHAAPRSRLEVLEASTKPVLMTHANAAGVRNVPRNASDEELKLLAKSGGVIGLMFWRPMVKIDNVVTVEDVLDHFDYIADLIGVQHIGVGTETPVLGFDRCTNLPTSQVSFLEPKDSMDIPDLCGEDRLHLLTEGLVRRGYSDEDIKGMLGGNFKRVFDEIMTV